LADAWFGNKTTIRTAEESLLTAVVRMKKDAMKYRLTEIQEGQAVHREVAVKTLYQACIRGQWEKIPGQPYQAKALDVGLNLSESPKEPERWIKVRLLLVRGVVHGEKAQAGKHDWAVFLTTDPHLAPQRILELYALRWAVEVYFKEAKRKRPARPSIPLINPPSSLAFLREDERWVQRQTGYNISRPGRPVG
jgi:hypothetical protein